MHLSNRSCTGSRTCYCLRLQEWSGPLLVSECHVSLDALPCSSPTLQFGFFQQLLIIMLPSQSPHPMFRGSPLPQLLWLSGRWGFLEGRDRNYPPMLPGARSLKSRSHRATQLQQHLWGPLASFHFQELLWRRKMLFLG